MLYTAGQIILLLVLSGAIGLGIGYFLWARKTAAKAATEAAPAGEHETLQRQLAATRKRAALAEAEVAKQTDAMQDAASKFETRQKRITELEGREPRRGDSE